MATLSVVRLISAALLGGFFVMACALKPSGNVTFVSSGDEPGKPVSRFPTPEQMAAPLHRQAAAAAGNTPPYASVEHWAITTPIPPTDSAYVARSNWDRMLVDGVGDKQIAISAALTCAAQESARFFTEHGGYPDDPMRRFFVARCGSSLVSTSMATLYTTLPANTMDATTLDAMGAELRKFIAQAAGYAPTEIGLGYAKGNRRAAFALIFGTALGKLDATPLKSGDGAVMLSGTLRGDAAYVMALANQGAFGVRNCQFDRRVAAPKFTFTCPLAAEDERTTIEIVSRREGDMLWQEAMRLIVPRDSKSGVAYEGTVAQTQASSPTGGFAESLHRAINDTRRSAGRPEVELVNNQTSTNQRFARSLFEANQAGNREDTQTIALGLLAGWDVPGEIRNGALYFNGFAPVGSAERWRDAALESPLGRYTLLNPDMTRMAVGVHQYTGSGTMAVVSTYALFGSPAHTADETVVFREIVALRRARNQREPERIERGVVLTDALAKIASGGQSVHEAMSDIVMRAQAAGESSAQVWVVETNSLFQFLVPDALYRENLRVEVGVTHYKPQGAAWGQYVLLFVVHPQAAKGATTATALPPFHTALF